jgi:capsular polysaccharide transport system permease protein
MVRGSLHVQDNHKRTAEQVSSSLSDEASHAPEIIRQRTIRILSERIRLMGIAQSGAYEHYNLQLSNGFPIPPGEVAILDMVRRKLPRLRSYHEVGSGLGTLPLMLAYDGFTSIGIERDEGRHLTATAILRELSADSSHIESNCRLIGAAFPDAVADLDVSDSIAILTDFVSSQAPKNYVRLCHRLAQYRYVLVDMQRFCRKRETKVELEQLTEEFAHYGLSPCSEVIDLGGQGFYRLFEGKVARGLPNLEEESSKVPIAADDAAVVSVDAVTTSTEQPPNQLVTIASKELKVRAPSALKLQKANDSLVPGEGMSLPPMPKRARHKRGGLISISALAVIGIPSLLAIVYYGLLASSQYVTSFQFAVRGASQAAAMRLGGSSMAGPGAASPDSFVVTDYISSPQAIGDMQRDIDLKAMFSKTDIDFWSRLPPNPTSEELSVYWSRVVSAHFDLITGNVSVSVHAFTPEDSLKLAQTLIARSDEMFRKLNNRAQQDTVRVADENVDRAQRELTSTRRALLLFREKSGVVDADKSAQASASIVDDLRKQLSVLQTQYASTKALAPNSPTLIGLSSQISALEGQIRKDDLVGSSHVKAVSAETLAQYQSLDLDHQIAEKQYAEALALRSQAYLMAQNQQSYLALFVAPTLAQASIYPNRLRAIAAVMLTAAAAWFVGMLVVYALRDHLM